MRKPRTRAAASTRPKAAPGFPRFRAYLAVSLDGYIADRDGGVKWLNPYFSPELDFAAFWRTIGATVMGRATWEWMVAHKHPLEGEGPCIVQTHRPLVRPPPGVEAFDGDVRELAARLRKMLAGSGRDVCLFGGGESIASFRRHGLVDSWELAIIPVLLGDGIPLFLRHERGLDSLDLQNSRSLKNGIIEVCYHTRRSTPRRTARRRTRPRAGC